MSGGRSAVDAANGNATTRVQKPTNASCLEEGAAHAVQSPPPWSVAKGDSESREKERARACQSVSVGATTERTTVAFFLPECKHEDRANGQERRGNNWDKDRRVVGGVRIGIHAAGDTRFVVVLLSILSRERGIKFD